MNIIHYNYPVLVQSKVSAGTTAVLFELHTTLTLLPATTVFAPVAAVCVCAVLVNANALKLVTLVAPICTLAVIVPDVV